MMNELIQHEFAQGATLDFEELQKLTEDCRPGQVREQGITIIREIHSQKDKPVPKRTKRFVPGSLSSRWSRSMNLEEFYRVPSLFTWRC